MASIFDEEIKHLKKYTMGNVLYFVAVILIIFWLLGFFVYSVGSIIHVLLVFAVIAILVRVIKGEKAV
jgi:cytochrome c biogenesis protein CcdA